MIALSLTSVVFGAPPKVLPIEAPGLKKEVARLKGKVVVINFWATWCPPCVAEFPDLVAAQKKLAAQGVTLLTVSMDDAADISGAVIPFLTRNQVTSGAFINKEGQSADIRFFAWLDGAPPTSIAIPRTYILDRKGKVVARLIGGQTGGAFEKAIKKALAAK